MAGSSVAVKKTQRLYDEVVELILERDKLAFFNSKEIELRYGEAVEGRALYLQRLQIDAVKLEQRIMLMNSGVSREDAQRRAEDALMEDEMLYELQKNVKDKRSALSEEEKEEADELYSKLIRILHPDLNPNQTLDMATLFIKVSAAYEHCRIDWLKMAVKEAESFKTDKLEELSDDELKERQKALKAARGQLRTSIDDMLDEYPFDKEEIIEDEEELAKEKAALDASIEALKTVIAEYEKSV